MSEKDRLRVQRLQELMIQADVQALICRLPENVVYISDYWPVHGISVVVLAQGGLPETDLYNAALRNFHPKRSGDILVVFESNHFINDFDGLIVSSTHGSPWNYDTHVPIIYNGPGIGAQVVDRRVHTVDVAATIAALLNIRAPSGSIGEPLKEVLSGD